MRFITNRLRKEFEIFSLEVSVKMHILLHTSELLTYRI